MGDFFLRTMSAPVLNRQCKYACMFLDSKNHHGPFPEASIR